MTPLVREMVAMDADTAMSFTWFDIGTLPRFEFAWSELPGSRLPFDRCAIVGRDSRGDKFLVLAEHAEESVILLAALAFTASHYTRTPNFALYMEPHGCKIASVEGEEDVTKERAAPIVGILAEFLRAANPVGYRATEKRNSPTNMRRAEKGKPPLIYDWHTVTIEPAKPKCDHLGGTHARPRQHERRGHWRRCASGKLVWVRHCIVGDPARGAVFKDYVLGVEKGGKQ